MNNTEAWDKFWERGTINFGLRENLNARVQTIADKHPELCTGIGGIYSGLMHRGIDEQIHHRLFTWENIVRHRELATLLFNEGWSSEVNRAVKMPEYARKRLFVAYEQVSRDLNQTIIRSPGSMANLLLRLGLLCMEGKDGKPFPWQHVPAGEITEDMEALA